MVPWCIRNRWVGNTCADLLADIGLTINGTMWWDNAPDVIRQYLIRNKLGLPNYRFVNF